MFSAFISPVPDPPRIRRPLFSCKVSAGFPSPAQDHIERSLDLNELLRTNKPSVFYLRLEGESMLQAGMHEGDYLVVDRSLKPVHKRIVIAVLDGDLTVKRLHLEDGRVELHPATQVRHFFGRQSLRRLIRPN